METIEIKTKVDGGYAHNTTTFVLSDLELETMHGKQLLKLLQSIRAILEDRSRTIGWRCCEYCNEYVGENWQEEVYPHLKVCEDYISRIKKVLETHPHYPNKKEAKKIRQEKTKTKKNR